MFLPGTVWWVPRRAQGAPLLSLSATSAALLKFRLKFGDPIHHSKPTSVIVMIPSGQAQGEFTMAKKALYTPNSAG